MACSATTAAAAAAAVCVCVCVCVCVFCWTTIMKEIIVIAESLPLVQLLLFFVVVVVVCFFTELRCIVKFCIV